MKIDVFMAGALVALLVIGFFVGTTYANRRLDAPPDVWIFSDANHWNIKELTPDGEIVDVFHGANDTGLVRAIRYYSHREGSTPSYTNHYRKVIKVELWPGRSDA